MCCFLENHAGFIANVPKNVRVLFKILSCFLLLKNAVFTIKTGPRAYTGGGNGGNAPPPRPVKGEALPPPRTQSYQT